MEAASTSSTPQWAISSEPVSAPRARRLQRCGILLAAGAVLLAFSPEARARVYATQQEALERLLPPPAEVERRTAYLSEEQVRRVEALSGETLQRRVVQYYVGRVDGKVVGYAFTDAHIVRTLPESVLFGLDTEGRIRSTEILSFDEPPEYLPGERWLEQLQKHTLDDRLSLKRDIRTLTGATISSRVITEAARRVLALYQVIIQEGETGAAQDAGGEGTR